jgi:hypothetical protein
MMDFVGWDVVLFLICIIAKMGVAVEERCTVTQDYSRLYMVETHLLYIDEIKIPHLGVELAGSVILGGIIYMAGQ